MSMDVVQQRALMNPFHGVPEVGAEEYTWGASDNIRGQGSCLLHSKKKKKSCQLFSKLVGRALKTTRAMVAHPLQ